MSMTKRTGTARRVTIGTLVLACVTLWIAALASSSEIAAQAAQPRAFSSRQHAYRLLDVVAREQKAAENGADVRDHVDRRISRENLVDRARRIEPRHRVAYRRSGTSRVGWDGRRSWVTK